MTSSRSSSAGTGPSARRTAPDRADRSRHRCRSGSIKQNLPPSLVAKIAPHEAAITFVTVGELIRWVFTRELGARRRGQIEQVIAATPKIPGGVDVARKWGELVAFAAKRGRPMPVNDSWVAACCLVYGLPLATLNLSDFADLADHEGLTLITP